MNKQSAMKELIKTLRWLILILVILLTNSIEAQKVLDLPICDRTNERNNPNVPLCYNGGTCYLTDPKNSRKYICKCRPGYIGQRCFDETPNECRFERSPPCDRRNSVCNPCYNDGKCTRDSTDLNIYKCDCPVNPKVRYIGEHCNCARGNVTLGLAGLDKANNIIIGRSTQYQIRVDKAGNHPFVVYDMGDGKYVSHASKKMDQLECKPGKGLDNAVDVCDHKFEYKYTKLGDYTVTVYLTNCDPNSMEDLEAVKKSEHLSDTFTFKLTVRYPPEVNCLPGLELGNVAQSVSEATIYTRTEEFTVPVKFISKCNETFEFKTKWSLFKLKEPYLQGIKENDQHIDNFDLWKNKATLSEDEITFHQRSLTDGKYLIEYTISVILENTEDVTNSAVGYFKMDLNPPKISIDGGFERAVDVSKEVILDASGSIDESFPEDSHHLMFNWKCENCELGLEPSELKKSKLIIPPGNLKMNEIYDIHLDVSTTHAMLRKAEPVVINVMGANSSLSIECVENCEKLNPEDQVLFRCICGTCSEQPKVTFSWEPATDIGVEFQTDESFTNVRLPHVDADDSISRIIICMAVDEGTVAKEIVDVNKPPVIGKCTIDPNTGEYLKTSFSLECEEFKDEDGQIEFSFYAKGDSDKGKDIIDGYLLSHDTNPQVKDIYLPFNKTGDVTLMVKATDKRGLSSFLELGVDITTPDSSEYPELLEKLIYGNNSLMKSRQAYGDNAGALQLQLVVLHGLLNNEIMIDYDGSKLLRAAMSNVLQEVKLQSFKSVEQTLNTLYFMKNWESVDSETLEELANNSIVLFNATSRLAAIVAQDAEIIPTELIKILARAATDTTSRIMKQTFDRTETILMSRSVRQKNERMATDYDEEDDIPRDYFQEAHPIEDGYKEEGYEDVEDSLSEDIKEYAKISHHAYRALEHLLDAVGERVEVGNNFTVQTEEVTISTQAFMKVNSAGFPLTIETNKGDGVKLIITGNLQDIMTSNNYTHIQIQVTEVLSNPFFDDTSAIIFTPVISVLIKDGTYGGQRLPIVLEDVDKPFEFMIPLKPTSKELLEASKITRIVELKSLNLISEADVDPFHLILKHNEHLEIQLNFSESWVEKEIEFSVVFNKDYRTEKRDYCEINSDKPNKILNAANNFRASFTTEILGLNEEPEEKYLDYYIGIFPYEIVVPTMIHKQLSYSVYFTRSSCLYRNENHKFWSEEGCILGRGTSATMLHCLCNHASIFAGTKFVIPNSISTLSIFDFNLDEYQNNPIILVTVCVLLCLYTIGMIICFLLDRKDRKGHVGITIMADIGGDYLDQSYYLITVKTDSRFAGGTTANVCIQIYGTNGRSQVYTLKEKSLPVLNRGGADTYLVSSNKPLGDIEKIRMWHDNSGRSPTWFCRRVVVTDIKTSEEWCFYVYRWMHVTGKESSVILEQNSATEKEHNEFGRRYKENLSDQFDNSHLWLSLFRHPTASHFTRCQRLSCAFAILTSYMLINILFYGIELQDPDDEFGLQTYAFAFQHSIFSLPFGIILVMIFRRIRARYIPTLIIWRNRLIKRKSQDTDTNVFIPQQIKKLSKTKTPRHSMFGNQNQTLMDIITSPVDEDGSDVSSNFSIPSTNIEDLEQWLENDVIVGISDDIETQDKTRFTRRIKDERSTDVDDQIALGRLGLIRAVRASDPTSFVFTGDNSIPEVERLIDQEIKAHISDSQKTKHSLGKRTNIPLSTNIIQDESSGSGVGDRIEYDFMEEQKSGFPLDLEKTNMEDLKRGIAFETCEMSSQVKAYCYLPWWFIVFAWILCLGSILTCLYFTLLYGLHYGYLRSVDWLVGITTSFFLSLFFIQPLQILISAILLTIFCRTKQIFHEERFQILIKDQDDLGFRKPMTFRVFQPERKHHPLSGHEIFKLKVEARDREKLRNATLKLIFYGFLLIPLIIIAHSGHSKDNFNIVDNLRNLLQLKEDDTFSTIGSENEFYDYVEKVLLPSLHSEVKYNGLQIRPKRFDPIRLDDQQNLLVGVPRIRIVRVNSEECHISSFRCYGKYSIDKQDTASYNPLWNPISNGKKSTFSKTNDIWKFRSVENSESKDLNPFIPSISMDGEIGFYYGGGYVAELGRRLYESQGVVRYLKRARWIDQQTRAIFIEFTIVNPNVYMYANVVLMIERSPTQAFECSHHIQPLILAIPEDLEITPWLRASYLVLIILTIILIITFFWNISDATRAYKRPWFWMDSLVIIGVLIALGIALKRHFVVLDALKQLDRMKINQYINLQVLAFWDEIETALFSICLCVCLLKIFRILTNIDERFLITSLTLKVSSKFLGAYALFLLVILVAFASGGHFIFGNELKEFRTFGHSMISLIDQIVDVDFFEDLATTNRFLGPTFSFLFGFFVVFMALNLLISVLNQGLHEGKLISKERCRRWTYQKYFSAAMYDIFSLNDHNPQGNRLSQPQFPASSLQPDRLEGMKKATVNFLQTNLKCSEVQKLKEMKIYVNDLLRGTGYHIISNVSLRHREEIVKEIHIDKMRLITADFLKGKLGTQMSEKEFLYYSDMNRAFIDLRVRKLEEKLLLLNQKLDLLLVFE